MPLIRLVARCACSCAGREFSPGDLFDAPPLDAVVLVTARKATFAKHQDVARPAKPTPKKRTYKRRDLTAEP